MMRSNTLVRSASNERQCSKLRKMMHAATGRPALKSICSVTHLSITSWSVSCLSIMSLCLRASSSACSRSSSVNEGAPGAAAFFFAVVASSAMLGMPLTKGSEACAAAASELGAEPSLEPAAAAARRRSVATFSWAWGVRAGPAAMADCSAALSERRRSVWVCSSSNCASTVASCVSSSFAASSALLARSADSATAFAASSAAAAAWVAAAAARSSASATLLAAAASSSWLTDATLAAAACDASSACFSRSCSMVAARASRCAFSFWYSDSSASARARASCVCSPRSSSSALCLEEASSRQRLSRSTRIISSSTLRSSAAFCDSSAPVSSAAARRLRSSRFAILHRHAHWNTTAAWRLRR
mmetsp:Transcript_41495/g.79304  ORF Transcript_41495/g.79304 Transcript_41495/m.79304 type:complete len:360 (-) Transcript_41495:423-1502(-)